MIPPRPARKPVALRFKKGDKVCRKRNKRIVGTVINSYLKCSEERVAVCWHNCSSRLSGNSDTKTVLKASSIDFAE